MTEIADGWPKRPDGSNMTMGEMKPEDRKRLLKEAAARYKVKCEHPIAQAKMKEFLQRIQDM